MARNQQVTHIPNTTRLSRFRKSGLRSNMAVFIACTPANCARIVKTNDRLDSVSPLLLLSSPRPLLLLLLLRVARDSMLARRGFSRYPLSLFIFLLSFSLFLSFPFFDAVRLNYPSTLESEEEEEERHTGWTRCVCRKQRGLSFFSFSSLFFSSPLARLPFHALSFEGGKREERGEDK